MENNKLCILVVDDEVKMVKAVGDLLRAKGFHVYSANDGEEALQVYYEHNAQIDLILLDVMMPKLDGFDVLEELRENSEMVPVIMLTAKGEEYDQLKGFNAGADDYVVKPFSPSLLIARIENILRRLGKGTDEEINVGGLKISMATREISIDGKVLEMTRREYDLLYFLAINANRIFSRAQLLNQVWGYEFDGDDRTVDTHIKQIRMKLGDKSTLIKTIHRVGYKLEA